MNLRLDGKAALVTGGSQGLGFAMADALAGAGADVAILARRRERLDEAAARLAAHGGRVATIEADLADVDAAIAAVDRAAGELGRLDVLVTAAGTQLRRPILDVTPEEWQRVVDVNLRAVFFQCREAARHMLRRDPPADGSARGKILNVASLTAVAAWPNVSVYGATKGGVVALTKAMAREWGPLGITVNAIGPGTFPTELTEPIYSDPERTQQVLARLPLGRPGEPRDLAGATVLLCSSASDYLTGQVVFVDGGFLTT